MTPPPAVLRGHPLPRLLVLGVVLAVLGSSLRAEGRPLGQGVDPAAACPEGNLLAAAATDLSLPAAGRAKLHDGLVAREGAPWPRAAERVVLPGGPIVFDLKRPVPGRAVILQVDADVGLELGLSADGRRWQTLTLSPDPRLSGMRLRPVGLPGAPARYLRLRSLTGRPFAATEVALYCAPPPDPHGAFAVADYPERLAMLSPPSGFQLTPTVVTWLKLAVVLGVLLVIGVERSGRALLAGRSRDVLLVTLGVLGCTAAFNFGAYRYPYYAHEHDSFHYFVGSKYFPELGYTRLYDCAALAEAESGFEERVRLRTQRDLRTNRVVSGEAALAAAEACRERFSPRRWAAFAQDVGYFANARFVPEWHRALRDHGFNASPLWVAFAGTLAGGLVASPSVIGHGTSMFGGVIGLLDPALLAGAALAVVWAFGWRIACVAAVVLGCNPLADFLWTGGAYLRTAWLAVLILAICLLRRRRLGIGGAALGAAAGLQLFPALCVLAVVLAGGWSWLRRRRPTAAALWIAASAGAGGVLLFAASSATIGRWDAWLDFAENIRRHAATPAANLVGLPAALSFRPSTRADLLFDPTLVDAFEAVREARRANLAAAWPLHAAGTLAAGLVMLRAAGRRSGWWAVAALGLLLVPFAMQTSSYYTAWLAVAVLLTAEDRDVAPLLLLLITGLLGVHLATRDTDLRYAIQSWLLVFGAGVLLWRLGWPRADGERRPAVGAGR